MKNLLGMACLAGCWLALMFIPQARTVQGAEILATQTALKAKGGVNLRVRSEFWDTFERQGVETDDTYNFLITRARGFADLSYGKFTFHMMVQFVNGINFPDEGAFGPGPAYFTSSDRDENATSLQLVELSLQARDVIAPGTYLNLGRIGIQDGLEVQYASAPKINWLKKWRLSERLIGTAEWPNVARRFDGGVIGYGNKYLDLNLFWASVLEGVFDFDDGYEHLDKTAVAGATLTLKKCSLISDTEIRAFNYFYFDSRDPAKTVAGDDIEINTTGASVVGAYKVGPGEADLLLWGAYQFGNFGESDQQAYGFITEAGYQLLQMAWKPWLRVGFAYASGDDNPSDSDNGSFFNLVPTNHKYYGSVDALAFSNLQNYYAQLILTPSPKVTLALDGHYFRLASDDSFWTGGTGAFNNLAFGYNSFRPVAGEQIDDDLGAEVDVTLTVKPADFLSVEVGYSRFFGRDGVSAVFDGEDQLNWFYVQSVVSFTR